MVWIAMFGIIFTLLFCGVWIAVALGIAGVVIMQVWGAGVPQLGSALWSSLDVYGFSAIPAFMFVGEIILQSGMSKRMYDSVSPLVARLPGKLLHANIVASALFAAVFGSSAACAAAVGSVAIPELQRRGYNKRLVLGSICVAGTLAFMIPPSGQFILYGSVAQVSIAALFAAGVVPGIIMALLFMVYIFFKGKITPEIAPLEERPLSFIKSLRSLLGLWPLVILMVICVTPIYIGLATPTESAGLGAVASIIIGCVVSNLRWKGIKAAIRNTTKITCMLFFIILGSMILSKAVQSLGLPRQLIDWLSGLPLPPIGILVIIYVLYIILGCFFDGVSLMLMTLPFVYPLVIGLGYDPIWFGVFLTLEIEIAVVTPPVGTNLFVVLAIADRNTTLSDIVWGSMPFLGCCLVMLAIMTVWPGVVTWLPHLLHL